MLANQKIADVMIELIRPAVPSDMKCALIVGRIGFIKARAAMAAMTVTGPTARNRWDRSSAIL